VVAPGGFIRYQHERGAPGSYRADSLNNPACGCRVWAARQMGDLPWWTV